MMRKVLLKFIVLFGLIGSANAFVTMNDQSKLYDGDIPFAQKAGASDNSLVGKTMNIGNRTLTPIVPLNGQSVPSPSQYQNGKISVLGLTVKGDSGVDKKNYYQVRIKGKNGQLSGTYLIPEAALSGLTTHNAAKQTQDALAFLKNQPMYYQPCPEIGLTTKGKLTPEEEKKYRESLTKQRDERRPKLIPAERFTPGVGDGSTSYGYQGDAPFAGGFSTSVAGGSGLINAKEDDPQASNATEGCEFLMATEEGGSQEPSKDDFKACITNIHKNLLSKVSPPLNENNRTQFFQNLFELPNQEQELAAALFTLKGEMESGNKADGIMILKVLNNRRDNANNIQRAIEDCKLPSEPDRDACMRNATKDSVFNLLDIAVHRVQTGKKKDGTPIYSKYGQFSMYNQVSAGGNWHKVLDSSSDSLFDDQIDVLMAYPKANIQGSGDIDVNTIYHYVNHEISNPKWARYEDGGSRPKRVIRVTHPELGDLGQTNKHTVYENVDAPGRDKTSDGFRVSVEHEYRDFK